MAVHVYDRIQYDDQEVGSGNGLNSATVKVKTNYRTITFLKPPTGELLTWLQANATKGASLDPVSEWSVADISGATYKFALNSNGYYESNNKGVNNSAAVCRVNIHAAKACAVTFKCINYAESNYDYGLLGVIENVAAGDHFIDVKYRKDSSQSSNNDSLQFTVEITED